MIVTVCFRGRVLQSAIFLGYPPAGALFSMDLVGLLLVEAAFLVAAHLVGGPPWTVVAAIAFAVLGVGGRRHDGTMRESVWLILPSLGWLAGFLASGNRELFFPYSMYLAGHAALTARHRGMIAACLAGGLVVGGFLVIRVMQEATPRVLAIEAAAAGAILAASCLVMTRRKRSIAGDGLILAGASAAAFLALAL